MNEQLNKQFGAHNHGIAFHHYQGKSLREVRYKYVSAYALCIILEA
jgi:hypothetical protein